MTKDEALRLALEALKRFEGEYAWTSACYEAVAAIEAALEAKDEPFGYFRYDLRLDAWVQSRDSNQGAAFYTTPPQRKPLTDEEIKKCWDSAGYTGIIPKGFARAIEAAHGIKGEA